MHRRCVVKYVHRGGLLSKIVMMMMARPPSHDVINGANRTIHLDGNGQ